MKTLRLLIAVCAGACLLFLSVGIVRATHNEYNVAPTSFPEAAGAVRITISIGCTNPRDTKFQTVDGTAQSGRDYTAVSGQFAVSSSAPRTFDLPVLNDNIPESDESIKLIIEGPGGSGGAGASTGQGEDQGACIGTPSKEVMLYIHDDEPRSGSAAGSSGTPGTTGPSPGAAGGAAGGDEPTPSDATPGTVGATEGATPDDAVTVEDAGLESSERQSAVEFPTWAIAVAGLLAGAAIVGLIWFWRQRQRPEGAG
jgi:hypothetical protein